MPIDPNAIGAKTDPHVFEWTDRDTLLYALGVGAGTDDLAFTTENSHDIPQQVLPTYAVIACTGFAAAAKIGTFNFAMLLHGSQEIRLFEPLPAAGKLSVVGEVADIQDKGEGKNAVVMLKATGTDPGHRKGRRRDDVDRGHPRRGRLRRTAGPAAGGTRDTRPRARFADRAAHPRGPGADLPAVRRPQPAAQRSVVRARARRLSRSRSCTGCAPTASPVVRWSATSAAVTRRRSPRSRRGSPRRCSPARR